MGDILFRRYIFTVVQCSTGQVQMRDMAAGGYAIVGGSYGLAYSRSRPCEDGKGVIGCRTGGEQRKQCR